MIVDEIFPTLLAAIAVVAPAATPPSAPLRLEVENVSGRNVLKLVGESPVACSVSYELGVSDTEGGNRSVNRGTASIVPGVRRTFATVTVRSQASSKISARLLVRSCKGETYEQHWPA